MLLSALALAATLAVSQEAPPAAAGEEPAAVTSTSQETDELIQSGLRAFARRRYSQAAERFEQALEADSASAAAAFYLAYTYYKLAEPKRPFHPDKAKAAQMFARAYELDPSFRPAWSVRQ